MTQYNPEFLSLLNSVTAKRPRTVIQHILKYGYITTEEGCTDFNTFVGLDENSKVIPMPQYKTLDKTIFMERGTTTGFIEFLDEVSKGKY